MSLDYTRILHTFPTAIMLGITELLEGIDIGRLVFCGDTSFNRRLQSGHCLYSFHVRLGIRRTRYCFPKLVAQFQNLKHFSLFQLRAFDLVSTITIPISLLPLSLNSLHLNGYFDTYEMTHCNSIDQILPNLTSLKLEHVLFEPEQNFAQSLPKSLTCIEMATSSAPSEFKWLELLPKYAENITSLHVVSPQSHASLSSKKFNPELTQIGNREVDPLMFDIDFSFFLHLENFSFLYTFGLLSRPVNNTFPSSITELSIYDILNKDENFYNLKMVPSSVKKLAYNFFSRWSQQEREENNFLSICKLMPKNLTSLFLDSSFKRGENPDTFLLLPRTLTSLKLLLRPGINMEDEYIKNIPPSLTHLEMPTSSIKSSAFIFLPRTLTFLLISPWHSLTDIRRDFFNVEHLYNLPPKLKTMIVRNIDILDEECDLTEIAIHLPKSLTKLTTGRLPLGMALYSLPHSLTSLSTKVATETPFIPNSQLVISLNRLTFLKLECSSSVVNDDFLAVLPRTLTQLEMRVDWAPLIHTFNITTISPRKEDGRQFLLQSWRNLPHSLKTLHFRSEKRIFEQENTFEDLPPSLESLTLLSMVKKSIMFSFKTIKKLPQSLGYLSLDHNSIVGEKVNKRYMFDTYGIVLDTNINLL